MKVEKIPAVASEPFVRRGQNTILTIGNFDGCHLGHQCLLQATLAAAKQAQAIPCAMTFSPSPSLYFGKHTGTRLFTPSQQIRAFAELGIEILFLQEFSTAFASLTYQAFYERIRDQLGLIGIVVGDDFCFGKNRSGNIGKLRVLTHADHLLLFSVGTSSHVAGNQKISSSHIRELLRKDGNIQEIQALLGRPYLIEGGLLGATSPSAFQVQPETQLLPKPGQYRGYCWWGDATTPPPTVMHADTNLPLCSVRISPMGILEVQLESDILPPAPPVRWGIYLSSLL